MIREWRNEPDAVRFSVTGRPVMPDEHAAWFARQLEAPAPLFWIAEHVGDPVGQVRVDVTGTVGTVSIAVASRHRGRGIGTSILRAMLSEIDQRPALSTVIAFAHPDNIASMRAFESAGFRREQQLDAGLVKLTWP
jgi:UDP-2,4-diacetamido-2,4,6-trideoxy-beta-L-altropyranose hydrolase